MVTVKVTEPRVSLSVGNRAIKGVVKVANRVGTNIQTQPLHT